MSFPRKLCWDVFRAVAACLFVSAICSHGADRALPPAFRVNETKVISHEEEHFHGWPTVICRKNGELMLVYSGGREDHACPFGRVEVMTSRDNGATWSWPRTLMDSVTDDRDSGLMETGKGTLIVTFFTSIGYKAHLANPALRINEIFKDEAPGYIARSRQVELRVSDEVRKTDVGRWMMRSTDGGLTWSARLPMPCYSPHGPTQLADGRLFFAAADGKKVGVWISSDDGISWQFISQVPGRPGETHGVEAADGTLIVHVRDKLPPPEGGDKRWVTTQSTSSDGGKTWSTPQQIVEGFPSHLLKLRDGRLLMTYGVRKAPFGIRAKLSADNGKSWSPEMILTKDGATDDLGYPSTAELGDGSLLSVWYEVPAESTKAQLRQARWTLGATEIPGN